MSHNNALSLREYQMRGVTQIRQRIKAGDKVICFQGPTAMGKTRIFSYITYHAAQKNNDVMIIVHRKELLRQSHRALLELCVDHGLISPLYTPAPYYPVQVASIDTLRNRYKKIKVPKIIIVDEGHHAVSPTWRTVLDYFISMGSVVILFTATPNRLDGKGLGKAAGGIVDTLIMGPQPKELINLGFLAPPKIFRATLANPENLHTKFGEFKQDEAEDLMDRPTIIGDAVKSYSSICPNLPTIVFVPSLKMGAHVVAQYQAAGYQSALIEGGLDDRVRERMLTDLGGGGLHTLVSCSLIDEGVDAPIVEGIQLLSPTQSLARFLQRGGRGARMFPGKDGYFLLDHVCNTFYPNMQVNHGDPSWDREWDLDGEVKKKGKVGEAGIAHLQCPNCYRTHVRAPRCPFCGEVYEVQGRAPDQVDGQLEQMDPAESERLEKIEENRARFARMSEERKCKTYQDFAELAKKRGYAQSWAGIRWAQVKKRNAATLPGVR